MTVVNGYPLAGTLGFSDSVQGEVMRVALSGSGRFGWTGSVSGRVLDKFVGGAATGTFGFVGHVRGHVGAALPATDWYWGTVESDPYIVQTLRVRLATRDGEYTIVDPAEIMALNTEENDHGGLESITLTLNRDARLQLGDLDFLTDCEIDYLGVEYHGRLEEQGLDHDVGMARPLMFKGPLVRLKDHRAFRKVYIDSEKETWQTDQGPHSANTPAYTVQQNSDGVRISVGDDFDGGGD